MSGNNEVDILVLQTERLRLRGPRMADALPIFDYARDPQVSRFLGWTAHRDIHESVAFLHEAIAETEAGGRLPRVIERREDGRVLGMIDVRWRSRSAGVGYVLAADAWGQGYATEALRVVLDDVFARLPVRDVWAICDLENPASARVLEKSGMTRCGVLRRYHTCPALGPEPRDVYGYARLRDGFAPEPLVG